MKLPITQEYLLEFEAMISKKENKPISVERRNHIQLVTSLINEAYSEGYRKGVGEVVHNG